MRIGIVGVGQLGKAVATKVAPFAEEVIGTTRNPNKIDELRSLEGFTDIVEFKDLNMKSLDAIVVTASSSNYSECFEELPDYIVSISRGHIIYAGSTAVYGDHKGGVVTEDSDLLGDTMRHMSLKYAERAYLNSERALILRLGGLYKRGAVLDFPKGDYWVNMTSIEGVSSLISESILFQRLGVFNYVEDQLAINFPRPSYRVRSEKLHSQRRDAVIRGMF